MLQHFEEFPFRIRENVFRPHMKPHDATTSLDRFVVSLKGAPKSSKPPTFESETVHGLPEVMNDIDAVCFDCYSTLVEITQKKRPYRAFISSLAPASQKDFRNRLMREGRPAVNWPTAIDVSVPVATMTRLEVDIDREVNSVSPWPAAIKIWRKLRGAGVNIAMFKRRFPVRTCGFGLSAGPAGSRSVLT